MTFHSYMCVACDENGMELTTIGGLMIEDVARLTRSATRLELHFSSVVVATVGFFNTWDTCSAIERCSEWPKELMDLLA